MWISAVQQSDSVIHTYILFHILFHYDLLQDTEYSSLCYTVGPCCLSKAFLSVQFSGVKYIHMVVQPRHHFVPVQPSESSLASNFAPFKERNRNWISVLTYFHHALEKNGKNGRGFLCYFFCALGYIADEDQMQIKFQGQRRACICCTCASLRQIISCSGHHSLRDCFVNLENINALKLIWH